MNIPVRIRSNGLIGILVSVQLVPIAGPPQLGLNAKGELIEGGPKQQGLQPFGVIALRDGFAVGPLGDMQPLDPVEVEQAIDEIAKDVGPDSQSRGTGEYMPDAIKLATDEEQIATNA